MSNRAQKKMAFIIKSLCWEAIIISSFLTLAFGGEGCPIFQPIRITDTASQIVLHSPSGDKWNSFNYTGKKPIMLILIGATPHIEAFKDTQQTIETAISQSIKVIQAKGIEVVTVVQPQFAPHGEAAKSEDFRKKVEGLNLHYADASTYTLYSASSNGITLVDIDKAGYLRHIEKLPVSNAIGAAIINAVDFSAPLSVSKAAPDFSTALSDQNNWRLADFRGWKKVLLLFMPEEMTCGCQNPVPSLQAKQTDLDDHDVEVLLISTDQQTTNNLIDSTITRFDFATDSNLNLHYLYYGAEGQNLTDALAVLIDKNGIVRYINKGSDPANFESNVIDRIINLDSN